VDGETHERQYERQGLLTADGEFRADGVPSRPLLSHTARLAAMARGQLLDADAMTQAVAGAVSVAGR
jgi:hypothetical protein